MTHVTLPMALGIFAAFAIYFGLILSTNYCYIRFLEYLQASHKNLWEALGRPEFVRSRWGFEKPHLEFLFIMLRRYRKIGDPELTRRGDAAFVSHLLLLPIPLLLFVSMVLGLWS